MSRLQIKSLIHSDDVRTFSTIYKIEVGWKFYFIFKKFDDFSMIEIGKKYFFKHSWKEKISEIILGFDPSNFSRQVKYFRLRISKKFLYMIESINAKILVQKFQLLLPIFTQINTFYMEIRYDFIYICIYSKREKERERERERENFE